MLWFSTAYGFAAGYHTSTLNHSIFDQPSLEQLSPEHQAALDTMSNKLTKLEQLQNSFFKKMERMILSQHKSEGGWEVEHQNGAEEMTSQRRTRGSA
jgi:hypothetical protein